MQIIEQRIFYYDELIDCKTIENSNFETFMKKFVKKIVNVNNTFDRKIDKSYDEVRDHSTLKKVNYEKKISKKFKFIEKKDYENFLNTKYYENCYEFIDHEFIDHEFFNSNDFEMKN